MCWNGPLVGIVPHKSLVETSLEHMQTIIITFHSQAIEHKQNLDHLHNFQGGNINKFPRNFPNQVIIVKAPAKEIVEF